MNLLKLEVTARSTFSADTLKFIERSVLYQGEKEVSETILNQNFNRMVLDAG